MLQFPVGNPCFPICLFRIFTVPGCPEQGKHILSGKKLCYYYCGGKILNSAGILIVEDDPIIATLIEFRLKKLGYTIFGKAKNEEEALDSINTHFPDLILMDVMLEGETDGILLAKKIHEKKEIPVVYLTGHTEDEILERVRDTGPSGFIIKPFSDDDLRVSIELAFHKKQNLS